jgi:hypothetical protein
MGKRIVRSATAEEATRHADVRRHIAEELPEIEEWAREAAAQCRDRVAVGTVFSTEERTVIEAIDAYAASHSLPNRSAVIREALARLLNMSIPAETETA